MSDTHVNRSRSQMSGPLPSEQDLYDRFLEHAEQVRLRFPTVVEPWPPHEHDLPCDDGMPVDSERHWTQRTLLLQTLRDYWAGRTRGYVAVNMGIYYNIDHKHKAYDWIDPDFFVVLDGDNRMRKCWVVWDEGRGPDVVIELVSPSTYRRDKEERRLIYQDILQVPEYFWYDPYTEKLEGLRLRAGAYEAIEPDADGSLFSERLGLCLVRRETHYWSESTRYLRFATPSGVLLPTAEEMRAVLDARDEAARHAIGDLRADAAEARPCDDDLQRHAEQVRRQAAAVLRRPDLDDETRRDIELRLAEMDESMQHLR